MLHVDPAFPRGSKEPTFGVTNRTKNASLYGAKIAPEEKALRLRPKDRHQIMLNENRMYHTETQQALCANKLTPWTFKEGMLVLGCVKQVAKASIQLILPGRIRCEVPISMISDAYSSRLQEMINTGTANCPTLSDLYSCGDLVYVKLMHKVCLPPQLKLTCSLKPSDLHDTFAQSQLVPGLVLSATIVAKEDHGYAMDVGIRNVHAFLPDNNLGQNRTDVGRNLFCSIESVSTLGSRTMAILKAFDPDAPRVLNVEEATLDVIVPGCKLMFTVGEPVKFGLRGMLFEDLIPAYVNDKMLTKATSTPEKYSMFKQIPATLLYVMPVTKQVFVSLTPYPKNRAETNEAYRPGTVIEKAYFKAVDNMGVWFQFQNKYRALLPRTTIMAQAELAGNVDESVVMGNYQNGTTERLVVVHHDPLENTYIVSKDASSTAEHIRSPKDIILGNTYKSRVTKVLENGVNLVVGSVPGAAMLMFYKNKRNIKVNDTLLVRAIAVKKTFVQFTNHPALVDENASILCDWDQLDESRSDQTFHGLITSKTRQEVTVKFFNYITGTLFMSTTFGHQHRARLSKLRVKTVEKFTVVKFDKANKQLFLTLAPEDTTIQSPVLVNVKVTCVHATGVDVRSREYVETGTIPSECLSEFGEHNPLYMRLLREGETLTVAKTNPGTYSLRLIPYFQMNCMNIESVEKGALLKGSCITFNGALYVTPLLSNFSKPIEIKTKQNCRKVEDGSIMMMRVLNVNKSSEQGYDLDVSTALEDVCTMGTYDVYNFIAEYLKDVKRLIKRYKEQNYAFAHYTVGQLVKCVVESIVRESNKLTVEVYAIDKESKYATKGIATAILPERPASSYEVGKMVSGRVVWIDVERKLVHVCLDQPLFERILIDETTQQSKEFSEQPKRCWILFANNYVRICCRQSGPPSNMLIVPVKHHYNDLEDRGNNAIDSIKVRMMSHLQGMIFAMEKPLHDFFGQWDGGVKTEDTNEEDADAEKDEDNKYNNGASDDELSAPTPTIMGTSNGKQEGEVSKSRPSKKGKDKSKLKRKITAEAKESTLQEQLPLKKKKTKKIYSYNIDIDQETDTVAKEPKTLSKKDKRAALQHDLK